MAFHSWLLLSPMISSQCSVCINSSYKPAEQVPTALLQSLFEEVIVIFSELPAVMVLKEGGSCD